MAPLTTTRTLFELRVGSYHTIEVLLQIRLSDIEWWNSDLYNHERQLYKLLGRRVLPNNECKEEIEKYRSERKRKEDLLNNNKEKKQSGEVVIGEANLKKKAADKEKSTSGKKRGRGKKAKKETKASKKQKVKDAANEGTEEKKRPKLLRETGKWIMGNSIQICYLMEDIENCTAATLIFRQKESTTENLEEQSNTQQMSQSSTEGKKKSKSTSKKKVEANDDDKQVPLSTFRSWRKLSKRINLWVFKFDPNNPSDLSVSEGGGFPRPDLLPMADIFR